MTSEIQVQYEEVYSKTAQLRSEMETELAEMDSKYSRIQSLLANSDGATNAQLRSVLENNSKKAHAVGNTINKLLLFIANSSQQVEIEESAIANTFRSNQNSEER